MIRSRTIHAHLTAIIESKADRQAKLDRIKAYSEKEISKAFHLSDSGLMIKKINLINRLTYKAMERVTT